MKKYREIHGCTSSPPLCQIFALVFMVIIEILGFYLILQMVELDLTIVYVLYALNYVAFIFLLVFFFMLVFSDPSDPRLKDKTYTEPNEVLEFCKRCNVNVS